MGANFAQAHPNITQAIKGSLSGAGQGLQQMNNPNPVFSFPQMQVPKKKVAAGVDGNQHPFPTGPQNSSALYG